MVAPAVSPFLDECNLPPSGLLVTAVLPGGCQLACPFCVVARRGERLARSPLPPAAYGSLVKALARRGRLGGVAVVGDEPLQPRSWPYAHAMLAEAERASTRSVMITNGMALADFLPELVRLPGLEILVSLDAVGARHDKIRGYPGAFDAISRGLFTAKEQPGLAARLVVATILMPGREEDVREVIRFVGSLGLKRLALSPLLVVNRGAPLRVHPSVLRVGLAVVPELIEFARSFGVELFLSDDFRALDGWQAVLGAEIRAPVRDARLIRVDAAGNIVTWDDIRSGAPPRLKLSRSSDALHVLAQRVIDLFEPDCLAAA